MNNINRSKEQKEQIKQIKEFEKWRIREELNLALIVGLDKAVKDFKSTTIEGYKPTKQDIDSVLSRLLYNRLNKK